MKEVYKDVGDLFSDPNVVCGILRKMKCNYDKAIEQDVLQAVAVSLLHSRVFERFDPNKNVKQLTFLHFCIRNAFIVSRYCKKNDSDPFSHERVGLFESDLADETCESTDTHDLEKYLSNLKPIERSLLEGLMAGVPCRETAKKFGITGSRAGQIVKNTLAKIKKRHFTKFSVYSLE